MHIREAFGTARAKVEALQRAGSEGAKIMRSHSDDVDEIVVDAFEAARGQATDDPAGIALVALGGYGRRELAPNSDLDLLLLYRGWSTSDVTALNRAVMYPLWDSGRELGDRIREPKDVIRSLDEIDEVCALLDARLLAGDRGLFGDLQASVGRRLERERPSFLRRLAVATGRRHERYGHAGHLLEPNIRDSAGGLRDIHTLGWASKVLPGSTGLNGLVDGGHLSRIDADIVAEAFAFLIRVRIELHLSTGRHLDLLYLAEQDEISKRLGYEAQEGRPAADRLMQELFMHARQADAVVGSFWHRLLHARPRRRLRSSRTENVGDGCVVKDGRLEVVAVTKPSEDPSGWMRVFRRSVLRDAPIGRASLNRLHEELEGTSDLAWSSEARDVFLDIIEAGAPGVRALEEMDGSGLLVALIPEWDAIRAFPQRDLYHRYTVDRHLFAAVEELATSRSSEDRDVHDAWLKVGDPDALFVAALFHDIGKGRGGDHSRIGAGLAESAARRIGLSDEQCRDVAFLVAEHLTLSETAVRRDLNDRRTVDEIAQRLRDERRLAMLYLLTRADSIATGAEAWSSFRSSLVSELYFRTREILAGAPEPRTHAPASSRHLDLLVEPLATDEVRTGVGHLQEADEFIVVAPDRPGMFSTVAGVLALRGIDIHDAEIYTRADGVAVEIFRVMGAHGAVPDERWERIGRDITAALAGDLDVDVELAKKASQVRRRRIHRRPQAGTRVVIDNVASDANTIIEVHTEDRLGLLRLITKTLTDAGCDLFLAKVATYGVEVVDVFYVRDLAGNKIDDPERLERIDADLLSALAADR